MVKPKNKDKKKNIKYEPVEDSKPKFSSKTYYYIIGAILIVIVLVLLSSIGRSQPTPKPPTIIKKEPELPKEPSLDYAILEEYSRPKPMFTQGFVFYKNELIESTGVYGMGVMQYLKFDEEKKEVYATNTQKIPDSYFGEGCDVIEDGEGNPLVY